MSENIVISRELLQQALEALDFSCPAPRLMSKHTAAEAALRAALAQPSDSELPDDIRVPLHRIWADIGYLIGRAKLGGDTDLAVHTVKALCDEVERAVRAALAQPLPDPVDEYRKGFIDGQIDMRDRLEAQEQEQKPVAWRYKGEPHFDGNKWHDEYCVTTDEQVAQFKDKECTPLYAHPPRREWQGLTEGEIDDLSRTMVKGNKSVNWLVLAILAKLKEKNHV